MSVTSTHLRQLVQTSAPDAKVKFDQDQKASTEKARFDGGRLFRSADAAAQNKADFQALMTQLRADKALSSTPGAVDAALQSIAKQAATGEPLTARLVAKALAAGDAHVLQASNAKARAERQMMDHLVLQLGQASTLTALLDGKGPQGSSPNATELPKGLRDALTAELLVGVQRQLSQRGLTADQLPHPKVVMNLLIDAALDVKPKLQAMLAAHANGGWQDANLAVAKASPQVKAAIDTVHTFAHARMNARLTASSGDAAFGAKQFDDLARDKVAAMDNKSLLGVMQSLQSVDAMALRMSLVQATAQPGNVQAQDLLEGLNAFEAHVLDAFASRVMQGNPPPNSGKELTPGQMTALGGQAQRDFKAHLNEQGDAFLSGNVSAPRQTLEATGAQKLSEKGIDALQLKKSLQATPLTLNFDLTLFDVPKPNKPDARSFLKPDGSVNPDALKMKNIFELPSNVKGPDYLERRTAIERHHFPELAGREDSRGLRAQDRPLYAAVNVGNNAMGAAATYGSAFMVLKDEVKQRALFAPTDTFYSYDWAVTDGSVQTFMSNLTQRLADPNSPYSQELKDAVAQDPSFLTGLREVLELEAFFETGGRGRTVKVEDLVIDKLSTWPSPPDGALKISQDDQGFLIAEAMKAFIKPGVDGATLDHVDRVFQNLSDDQLTKLKAMQSDPLRVNTGLGDYIEAQVFGGIDLNTDVAELHFVGGGPPDKLLDLDKVAYQNAQKIAEAIGAKFVYTDNGDLDVGEVVSATSPEGAKMLEVANAGHNPRIVSADAPFTPSVSQSNPTALATAQGGLASFRDKHLGEILDIYKGHEQSFDPEGIHGREHISRAVLYANILANFFEAQGAKVDRHALYTTTALHDAGREGNGVDRWEGDSAKQALERLQSQGITDESYLELTKGAIQGSSTQRHSLEALILKSADSLDIIRERGLSGYNTKFLAFMGGDTQLSNGMTLPQDTEFRDALIQEVAQFIDATSYHAPSEGAWLKARQDIDAINLKLEAFGGNVSSPQAKQLLSDLETTMKTQRDLRDQVVKEYQTHSNNTASLDVFNGIEAELLAHPDRYPIMARYYDKAR
jgi:hypothetical protein